MPRSSEKYPRWGKDKLVIFLHREGFISSASAAGRIPKKLKERGVLKELLLNHTPARKSQRQRPYVVRKPKDYVVNEPRDIGEVDTPLRRMPFPAKVIQVDGDLSFKIALRRNARVEGHNYLFCRHAQPNTTDTQTEHKGPY